MELGRKVSYSRLIDNFDNRNIFVSIILFSLVGQVIGGSGGPLFFVEVVATAVVFFLTGTGGGLISSQTAQCWFLFICFSICSFWGFIIARIGSIVSLQKYQLTISSICLLVSIMIMTISLLYLTILQEWQTPTRKPAAASIGRRPFWSSLVTIVSNSSGCGSRYAGFMKIVYL